MRVALLLNERLNERQFADARIRLTQCDTVLFGEPRQALSRAMHQPRVGRKGDRFFLHGVDDHLGKVGRLGGSRPGRGRKALLQQGNELFFAHPLAPAGHRGPVEGELMLEELLAAEQLIIGVLDPARAQTSSERSCMCFKIAIPAVSLVGSGGCPGPSL